MCVHVCVYLLTFSLKKLLLRNWVPRGSVVRCLTRNPDFDEILQKCSCHGPRQNFLKKFDSVKNSGCHGNKTEKILKTLKIFFSETIRVRATKFGM